MPCVALCSFFGNKFLGNKFLQNVGKFCNQFFMNMIKAERIYLKIFAMVFETTAFVIILIF